MALEALCVQVDEKGGIPSDITLSIEECTSLLDEIKELQQLEKRDLGVISTRIASWKNVKINTELPTNLNDNPHPYRLVKQYHSASKVIPQTHHMFIKLWAAGQIHVKYKYKHYNIPLIASPPNKPLTSQWNS